MSTIASRVQGFGVDMGVVPEQKYIADRLSELANLHGELKGLGVVRQMLIDDQMTDEIKEAVSDIRVEFAPQEEILEEKMKKLKDDLKPHVLRYGKTVSGPGFTGAYIKGDRVNAKKLRYLQDKYPAIEDEIEACFESKPTVRFSANKRGK